MKNKQQATQPREVISEPMNARLYVLVDEALRAQPYTFRERGGDAAPLAIKQSTVKGLSAFLKTSELPKLFNANGELIRAPEGSPAATTITLDAALIKNSRVAQAGSHVFVHEDQTKALAVGRTGVIAMESKPSALRVIDAAKFSTVDVEAEDDVTVSTLPVSAAKIDFTQAVAKGFRVEIPRSERKDVSTELICSELVSALALGLARAADEVLLSAIASAAPPNFSIALAAARGLKFSELSAIVGTSGNGATVSQDGHLRTAGVPAELTDTIAPTIVGAFNRAGVAIGENVDIYFQRTSKNGLLALTAWSSMLALLPASKFFWTVPAA